MTAPALRADALVTADAATAPAALALGPVELPRAYATRTRVPRTASASRRAIAFGLDTVVILFITWTGTAAAATLGLLRVPEIPLGGQIHDAYSLLWLVSIFEVPVILTYFTLFEGTTGRTPGKALLGLRVQRADGARPTYGDAFLRNLLRLLWITPFAPAFILLDLWALESTELDQRTGDLAASTLVLDDRWEVENP